MGIDGTIATLLLSKVQYILHIRSIRTLGQHDKTDQSLPKQEICCKDKDTKRREQKRVLRSY